ncbi:MAG: hypothetical protein LBK77_05830, partial [Spirochaetaceae bacterium]|nr:hypothetical protein [Spirochaetaceae bacterium]
HEFRTLSLPEGYFGPADKAALAPLAGDSAWRLRPFVPGNCLDPAWNEKQTESAAETETPPPQAL